LITLLKRFPHQEELAMRSSVILVVFLLSNTTGGSNCPQIPNCSCSWSSGRQVLHCSSLNVLPALPSKPVSTAGVKELVVEKSNIPTMWTKKLYNKYHMSSLQRLDLTECGMHSIQEESFYDMSLLQHLNLSHNLLSRLEGDQLKHLTSLKTLDLSFNRLTWLGAGLLQSSPYLSNLHLQSNKLATLLPDFLPSTGKLKLLQLEGNPWQCDCRLLHLPPISAPPCDKLQDCPATVIALSKVPGTSVLKCHASGWPRPHFTWLKDGNIMVPEAAEEKEEDLLRKPVHIFSILREDSQPGNYTCMAGESSASITVASKSVTAGHSITLVIVVAASTSVLLLLLFLLLFHLWRRSHARKEEDRGLTTSLAGLEYRSTKLSTTNPVPKPPRTFTSQASTLALVEPLPLVKGITFPPSATPYFDNKPRSRASIGTVSLNSTFIEASPCVSPRNSSHPCCGAPPGYATLPKRFIAPPLGPRCSGDGSSFASLNLTCGTVAPVTPLPISTPVNVVNNPINTSGLPPSYSPIPPRPLQTIQEQE